MRLKKLKTFVFVIALIGLTPFPPQFLLGAVSSDTEWKQQKATFLQASRREWNHNISEWREVESWTFDDEKMPESFHVFSGEWIVKEGKLRAVSGKPDSSRVIKIAHCQWPAFRMTFDVMLEPKEGAPADRIGDIGVGLNCDPETGSFAKGYVFIAAHYFNQANVLYRRNVPYARTENSFVEPGRQHQVTVEVVKPHLRLWVDGRVLLEGWERIGLKYYDFSDFLDMDPERIMTLHTYDSVMTVDNLKISIPVAPSDSDAPKTPKSGK